MTLNRFEAWWNRNPERRELSGPAKELARSIWNAAQDDLADDALWMSKLKVVPTIDLTDAGKKDKEETC